MLIGKLKWFNSQKNFGFITAEGKDYFVHRNGFHDPNAVIEEGMTVQFRVQANSKGPQAVDVTQVEIDGNV